MGPARATGSLNGAEPASESAAAAARPRRRRNERPHGPVPEPNLNGRPGDAPLAETDIGRSMVVTT